jgi:hypothetical protein
METPIFLVSNETTNLLCTPERQLHFEYSPYAVPDIALIQDLKVSEVKAKKTITRHEPI